MNKFKILDTVERFVIELQLLLLLVLPLPPSTYNVTLEYSLRRGEPTAIFLHVLIALLTAAG